MKFTTLKEWWAEKGCGLINSRTNDLIGQNIGSVLFENLFTDQEMEEISEFKEELYSKDFIEVLNEDGLKIGLLRYSDGGKCLRYYID
ncbi:MAG: hypothetical protein IJI83_03210 [Oscillospiraceae bacterium]|nr:hypothetical protein [Oscillospiraceae bacterium]